MPLYFVQHKHDAATWMVQDAKVAPQLLQLFAAAPSAGVTILSEAVVNSGHELNIIATADDDPIVEQFMEPFAQMGSVTVQAASHCELVVDRSYC